MLITPEIKVAKGAIFDTHCHYDDSAFENEGRVFAQLSKMGVCGGIVCGTELETCNKIINMTANQNGWYAAAGFHPENLPDSINKIDAINGLCKNENVIAVGEIGLDYHWDLFPRNYQKQCFEKQIIIANNLDLPVIVHDREAHADTLSILQKHRPKGVVHCFSGSVETAEEIIKLGMYIGVGGVVTFKNAKSAVEVATKIPLERILLETDAPYMAPHPYRGKTNHSGLIVYMAQKIAELKQISIDEVLSCCKENAAKLFKLTYNNF